LIEQACKTFIEFGVGLEGAGWVIIRSGELGAFIACRSQPGRWIDPYWTTNERVVDVTGKFLHGHPLVCAPVGLLMLPRLLTNIQVLETVFWVALPPASH